MSSGIKIPLLSFYSGGGFLDMGFEMAGFEIVWTNENDATFAQLHSAGITSWRKSNGNGIKAEIFNTKSIIDVKPSEIIAEAFTEGLPADFGIIGGPPCQDFSINGSRNGFKGERGKLTIQFFDKILELKPTFFIMENVPGLIKHKSYKSHLLKLLERLKEHYHLDHTTLNALNFGVPQFRERVFFIGIKKTSLSSKKIIVDIKGNWFKWPENSAYSNALTKYTWPLTSDFGKKLTKPKEIPIELCVENCLVSRNEMIGTSNANEFFKLYVDGKKLNKIKEGKTTRPSFKRLHRFRYSPTACYGNNEVHLHPYKNRRISVREALRIQGVPDQYVLPPELPLTKKFKMIGNGVPVPLANAVAVAVKDFLIEHEVGNLKKINGHLVERKA
ncbi:MAG: DNA cytosine methyltransferase [Bacteroidota bacterium]